MIQTPAGELPDTSRLLRAEQRGLRLAIICRTLVVGAAFLWVGSSWVAFGFYPNPLVFGVLGAFTAVGIAHAAVIGTRFDRWWMKFAIYTVDILGICAVFAFLPLVQGEAVPQILAFRAYGIYYLFPLVAMATLSLSPRLVLWSGGVAVAGWFAAFFVAISDLETTLSWSDLTPGASRADYEALFLSANFIGRGNRIEETGFLMIATLILALAVLRARRVFMAQVAAQAEREQIAATLGRYVPEAIARRLIDDPSALVPQERHAAILVMDIAGFTAYSAGRMPTEVIENLNDFLSGCAEEVSRHDGVVIQFTGDGLMASFGTPIDSAHPEQAAVAASNALIAEAGEAGFSIRIGLAAGQVAAGSIGSSDRQAFTVYGDTVNRAARLEAQAKVLGRSVLMDANVADRLSKDDLVSLGPQHLRGLADPIPVFALPMQMPD
ncbi:Adenylate cyclase 1 [Labrenzia sp. THAF82]|uniref:adenylate/guanylate cyclase domain-containing protein n=1 Tax=Labrenzia sp. THAF82 TaxID=2587861 RepID=UPI0012A860A5|nr:adenylate/guanylate cyclase domain-containing protein [Labrenzia sp. THAF82]QFT30843.1 Adenylate cyclase 1 [Labrenzia sp. THAF82]